MQRPSRVEAVGLKECLNHVQDTTIKLQRERGYMHRPPRFKMSHQRACFNRVKARQELFKSAREKIQRSIDQSASQKDYHSFYWSLTCAIFSSRTASCTSARLLSPFLCPPSAYQRRNPKTPQKMQKGFQQRLGLENNKRNAAVNSQKRIHIKTFLKEKYMFSGEKNKSSISLGKEKYRVK